MTSETVIYLLMGAAAGGFINGLAGTGTALFALGFYLVVLPPVTAIAVVALTALLAGLQGLWIVRSSIFANPNRLLTFLVPGLIGVPIGLMLLDLIDANSLRISIAVLLIIYGGYFGLRASLPAFQKHTPVLDASIGLTGGILGGAAALSGAIPAMYLSLRPWPKAETRAVLQPYNTAILCTTITLLFANGAYDALAVKALVVTIPGGLIAAQLGIFVFQRTSDNMFRRLLIILTLLMGLGIFASELF